LKKRGDITMKILRLSMILMIGSLLIVVAFAKDNSSENIQGPVIESLNNTLEELAISVINTHSIRATLSNFGTLGNNGPASASGTIDPCTGEWAPQFEYPVGSNVQYLFRGGLWIGAIVETDSGNYPRVSTAIEGWVGDEEMIPTSTFEQRSYLRGEWNCLGEAIYNPEALASEEYIASYSDTSRIRLNGTPVSDPTDGPHQPLGIEVTQLVRAWDAPGYDKGYTIEYSVKNISEETLHKTYVGLFVDGDVGDLSIGNNFDDDITGYISELNGIPVNVAYIADNDGRPSDVGTGNNFTVPAVFGTKLLKAPEGALKSSFNWWISNGSSVLDYGPSWLDDNSEDDWTSEYGTPVGDAQKYFLLSNGEWDINQVRLADQNWIENNPQVYTDPFTGERSSHEWKEVEIPIAADIANGFDTRFLMSWGPLGDPVGDDYLLEPGEEVSITVLFFVGDDFHDPNNPQPVNTVIDPSLFDFTSLVEYAAKNEQLYSDINRYSPPVAPALVRVRTGFTGSVVAWPTLTQLSGTVYDVFRQNSDATWPETPLNSEPIVNGIFLDQDVTIGENYTYRVAATRNDTLFSYASEPSTGLYGSFNAPENLVAFEGDENVQLSWDAMPDQLNVDSYNIWRTEFIYLTNVNLIPELIGTVTSNEYVDETVQNGKHYQYWIESGDVDNPGLLSDPVVALPMGFDRDVIMLLQENFEPGIPNEEATLFYDELLTDTNLDFELQSVENFSHDSLSLITLSPFKTLWLSSLNMNSGNLSNWNQNVLKQYLDRGGNLVIEMSQLCRFLTGGGPSQMTALTEYNPLAEYLGIDSLMTQESVFQIQGEDTLNIALAERSGYEDLNSVKSLFFNNVFFISTTRFIPEDESTVLYTYESGVEDSDYHHEPIANLNIGQNDQYSWSTALFGFPLYQMERGDALTDMVNQLISEMQGAIQTHPDSNVLNNNELFSIHPNPFNANTEIHFVLKSSMEMEIHLYNTLGQRVQTLYTGQMEAGNHAVTVDGSTLASGVYFVHAIVPGKLNQVQKIVLMK
jgi:Secretion system C-terminal sorting domain